MSTAIDMTQGRRALGAKSLIALQHKSAFSVDFGLQDGAIEVNDWALNRPCRENRPCGECDAPSWVRSTGARQLAIFSFLLATKPLESQSRRILRKPAGM